MMDQNRWYLVNDNSQNVVSLHDLISITVHSQFLLISSLTVQQNPVMCIAFQYSLSKPQNSLLTTCDPRPWFDTRIRNQICTIWYLLWHWFDAVLFLCNVSITVMRVHMWCFIGIGRWCPKISIFARIT